MTTPISKFFLLLAASDLSDKEIGQVSSWLERYGVNQLKSKVQSLRESGDYIDDMAPRRPTKSSQGYGGPTENVGKTAEQVDQLLRRDARLSTTQAAGMLLGALRKYMSLEAFDDLPKLGRESFIGWLQKMSKHIPDSVILHEATIIRNNAVHAPPGDWPLKDR